MKVIITKYAAACLLLYTAALSVIVFWNTNNMVVGILAIVAAVGWIAWWFERFVLSEAVWSQSEAGGDTAVTTRPGSSSAIQEAQQTGNNSAQGQALEDTRIFEQPNQMAEQVRVTIDEAEQAISLCIKAFKHIVVESGEMAQCAQEMRSWGSEKSPLINDALAHLAERSGDIGGSAQDVVTTFQFHDLLRQRLENIAAYLDTIPGMSADGQEAEARIGETVLGGGNGGEIPLPSSAVRYTPKSGDQNDVTLF